MQFGMIGLRDKGDDLVRVWKVGQGYDGLPRRPKYVGTARNESVVIAVNTDLKHACVKAAQHAGQIQDQVPGCERSKLCLFAH